MTRVAIVIVTYNSAAEIGGCLDALRRYAADAEVVVVDNASADETREIVTARRVRLLASATNLGFAGGVNLGIRETSAPLILLLNPDAHLETGLEAMENRIAGKVGYAGGLLVDDHGRPQGGFMIRSLPTPAALAFEVLGLNRVFPWNPANWHYRCKGKNPMTPGVAEQPAGAFLMFSRSLWLELGGLDERFSPVWFEDVDFCARAVAAGFVGAYEPGARARHAGGHSFGSLGVAIRHKYWYGNLLEYAEKHYGIIGFRVVCLAVAAGALLRAVIEWPRHGFKAFQMYGGILRLSLVRVFRKRTKHNTAEGKMCEKSGGRE